MIIIGRYRHIATSSVSRTGSVSFLQLKRILASKRFARDCFRAMEKDIHESILLNATRFNTHNSLLDS